jgi:NTP pyrophosphatase (non-canonical NTP hydrolase)
MNPLTLEGLRTANARRATLWHNGRLVPLEFYMMELAGECGEACNAVKKLCRAEMGIAGGDSDVSKVADELADVVICADLAAMRLGIDLGAAVARKFNQTSRKYGFDVLLAAARDVQEIEG